MGDSLLNSAQQQFAGLNIEGDQKYFEMKKFSDAVENGNFETASSSFIAMMQFGSRYELKIKQASQITLAADETSSSDVIQLPAQLQSLSHACASIDYEREYQNKVLQQEAWKMQEQQRVENQRLQEEAERQRQQEEAERQRQQDEDERRRQQEEVEKQRQQEAQRQAQLKQQKEKEEMEKKEKEIQEQVKQQQQQYNVGVPIGQQNGSGPENKSKFKVSFGIKQAVPQNLLVSKAYGPQEETGAQPSQLVNILNQPQVSGQPPQQPNPQGNNYYQQYGNNQFQGMNNSFQGNNPPGSTFAQTQPSPYNLYQQMNPQSQNQFINKPYQNQPHQNNLQQQQYPQQQQYQQQNYPGNLPNQQQPMMYSQPHNFNQQQQQNYPNMNQPGPYQQFPNHTQQQYPSQQQQYQNPQYSYNQQISAGGPANNIASSFNQQGLVQNGNIQQSYQFQPPQYASPQGFPGQPNKINTIPEKIDEFSEELSEASNINKN